MSTKTKEPKVVKNKKKLFLLLGLNFPNEATVLLADYKDMLEEYLYEDFKGYEGVCLVGPLDSFMVEEAKSKLITPTNQRRNQRLPLSLKDKHNR